MAAKPSLPQDQALVFDLGKKRFVVIGFDQMKHYTARLASRILHDRGKPSAIVYVQRGGMVIARLLSDALGVRELHGISASYYTRSNMPSSKLRIGTIPRVSSEGYLLLVDDIADTGKTLSAIAQSVRRKDRSDLVICTFGMKPKSIIRPDYYAFTVSNSTWVIFDYEEHETRRNFARTGNRSGMRFMDKRFGPAHGQD